jgi:hypothetical protein
VSATVATVPATRDVPAGNNQWVKFTGFGAGTNPLTCYFTVASAAGTSTATETSN